MAVKESPVIKPQQRVLSPFRLESLWVAEVLMLLLYCQRADKQQVSLPHLKAACNRTGRHHRCQAMTGRMAQKLGSSISCNGPRAHWQPALLCSLEGLHKYATSRQHPTEGFCWLTTHMAG